MAFKMLHLNYLKAYLSHPINSREQALANNQGFVALRQPSKRSSPCPEQLCEVGVTGYLKIHKMLWFGIGPRNADSLPIVRAVNYFTERFMSVWSDKRVAIRFCAAHAKRLCMVPLKSSERVFRCFPYWIIMTIANSSHSLCCWAFTLC